MSRASAGRVRSAPDTGTGVPLGGLLLLGALTLFWGCNWPAMKLGLRTLPPWTFRTVCLAVGGVGLLGIAKAGGHPLRIPRGERGPICLVAFFNITAWHLLSAYGLMLIQAGRAAILAYTMPLWAVLLGRALLGERLTPARRLGLGLGLLGMAILVGPEARRLLAAPVGALLVVAAAACWALGTVIMKRYRWTLPTVLLTGWQVALGGLPVLAGALLLETPPPLADLDVAGLAGTAYAAVIGVILCHYLWFRIVRMLPSGVAAIATLGVPVVGVFSSALVLGEGVGLAELAALGLVVSALGLVLGGPRRPVRGHGGGSLQSGRESRTIAR